MRQDVIMTRPTEPAGSGTREAVLTDLVAEGDDLDGLVAGLDGRRWAMPTPSPGWSIAHQIAHLSSSDFAALASVTYASGVRAAVRGLTDPSSLLATARVGATSGGWFVRRGFRRWSAAELTGLIDALAEAGSRKEPATVLARWRSARTRLAEALAAVAPATKVRWLGTRMSPTSLATARLMETWAHGQDVADALRVRREPTARLRHVARLAVRNRDHAYRINGRTPPAAEFRVELTAPDGTLWTWGPDDTADRVIGPAVDFCLLATQRRNLADLDLTGHGAAAEWLTIAQAYAGPPGQGRAPGTAES